AHALGPQVDGHLFDARLTGEVALDVRLAFGAGNIRRGQLDIGEVHVFAPMLAGACAAAGVCGSGPSWLAGRRRRSRSALPTTVTELVAMVSAASTGGRIPAAARGTRSRL